MSILIYTEISDPGWQFFRFYLGDVVAVMFLFFLLRVFLGRINGSPRDDCGRDSLPSPELSPDRTVDRIRPIIWANSAKSALDRPNCLGVARSNSGTWWLMWWD